jgi:hypothetical protein
MIALIMRYLPKIKIFFLGLAAYLLMPLVDTKDSPTWWRASIFLAVSGLSIWLALLIIEYIVKHRVKKPDQNPDKEHKLTHQKHLSSKALPRQVRKERVNNFQIEEDPKTGSGNQYNLLPRHESILEDVNKGVNEENLSLPLEQGKAFSSPP